MTIGAAAVVVPLLSLAVPAQAAVAGIPLGAHPGARAGAAIVDSTYFAGYQAAVTAGSATTSANRFTVPKLACTSAARGISAVAGVAVNSYKTYSVAILAVECFNDAAVYFPELVINGKQYNYQGSPAYAGNLIELSTSVTKTGTTVSVKDATRGFTKTKKGVGASASAAYMGDSGTPSVGVPSFGTIAFTNCKIDGATLASKHPTEYQRATSSGVLQISTGAVARTGTKFATHFEHS
jgi:hypothetical protein